MEATRRSRIEVSSFSHYRFVAQDETEKTNCNYCHELGGLGTEIKVDGEVLFAGCNHCLVELLMPPTACCGRIRTRLCHCGD